MALSRTSAPGPWSNSLFPLTRSSQTLDCHACRALVVLVEQFVEAWDADDGVIDEQKQFPVARGRYALVDEELVREIRIKEGFFAAFAADSRHHAKPRA